ncbi:hypothetical protein C8Q76DRAFT_723313 [Earliella scabrosa]|nr:hypothetical protein C8Q76DRAFT_723313 [Earliella scabrosa]
MVPQVTLDSLVVASLSQRITHYGNPHMLFPPSRRVHILYRPSASPLAVANVQGKRGRPSVSEIPLAKKVHPSNSDSEPSGLLLKSLQVDNKDGTQVQVIPANANILQVRSVDDREAVVIPSIVMPKAPSDYASLIQSTNHHGALVFDPTRSFAKFMSLIDSGVRAMVLRRPPQSGKTFLATALAAFMDCKGQLDFPHLFASTVAGRSPNVEHSRHCVLYITFDDGAKETIEATLNHQTSGNFRAFIDGFIYRRVSAFGKKYFADQSQSWEQTLKVQTGVPSANHCLNMCLNTAKQSGYKLVVILDDIDYPATLAYLRRANNEACLPFETIQTVIDAGIIAPFKSHLDSTNVVDMLLVLETFPVTLTERRSADMFTDISTKRDFIDCCRLQYDDYIACNVLVQQLGVTLPRAYKYRRQASTSHVAQVDSRAAAANGFYPPSLLHYIRSMNMKNHDDFAQGGIFDEISITIMTPTLQTAFFGAMTNIVGKLGREALSFLASIESPRTQEPVTTDYDPHYPHVTSHSMEVLQSLLLDSGVAGVRYGQRQQALRVEQLEHILVPFVHLQWSAPTIRDLLALPAMKLWRDRRIYQFDGTVESLTTLLEHATANVRWPRTEPEHETHFRGIVQATISLTTDSTVVSELHLEYPPNDEHGKPQSRYIDVTEVPQGAQLVRIFELKYVRLYAVQLGMRLPTTRDAIRVLRRLVFGRDPQTGEVSPRTLQLPLWNDRERGHWAHNLQERGPSPWRTTPDGQMVTETLEDVHNRAREQVESYFDILDKYMATKSDGRLKKEFTTSPTMVERWVCIFVGGWRVWVTRVGRTQCSWGLARGTGGDDKVDVQV